MFSLTQGGILVAVLGTVLVRFGFTEACSNEIVSVAPLLVGGITAWIGRYRKGDITPLGFKK
jgi:hypothetical protein